MKICGEHNAACVYCYLMVTCHQIDCKMMGRAQAGNWYESDSEDES